MKQQGSTENGQQKHKLTRATAIPVAEQNPAETKNSFVPGPIELATLECDDLRARDEVMSPRLMSVPDTDEDAGPNAVKIEGRAGKPRQTNNELGAALALTRAQFANCCGTTSEPAIYLMIAQISGQSGSWSKDTRRFIADGTLALMAQIKPRDAAEGMLAAQMVTTHNQIMRLHRVMGADGVTVELLNTYGNLISKLERTYAAQLEALSRYRNQGQQKVTVVHKHIDQRNQGVIVAADKAQVNIPGVPEGAGEGIVMEGQPHAPIEETEVHRIADSAEVSRAVEADRLQVQSASG